MMLCMIQSFFMIGWMALVLLFDVVGRSRRARVYLFAFGLSNGILIYSHDWVACGTTWGIVVLVKYQ